MSENVGTPFGSPRRTAVKVARTHMRGTAMNGRCGSASRTSSSALRAGTASRPFAAVEHGLPRPPLQRGGERLDALHGHAADVPAGIVERTLDQRRVPGGNVDEQRADRPVAAHLRGIGRFWASLERCVLGRTVVRGGHLGPAASDRAGVSCPRRPMPNADNSRTPRARPEFVSSVEPIEPIEAIRSQLRSEPAGRRRDPRHDLAHAERDLVAFERAPNPRISRSARRLSASIVPAKRVMPSSAAREASRFIQPPAEALALPGVTHDHRHVGDVRTDPHAAGDRHQQVALQHHVGDVVVLVDLGQVAQLGLAEGDLGRRKRFIAVSGPAPAVRRPAAPCLRERWDG